MAYFKEKIFTSKKGGSSLVFYSKADFRKKTSKMAFLNRSRKPNANSCLYAAWSSLKALFPPNLFTISLCLFLSTSQSLLPQRLPPLLYSPLAPLFGLCLYILITPLLRQFQALISLIEHQKEKLLANLTATLTGIIYRATLPSCCPTLGSIVFLQELFSLSAGKSYFQHVFLYVTADR